MQPGHLIFTKLYIWLARSLPAVTGVTMHRFRPLLETDFELVYPIEQAAHKEPWSQANLLSCFGPRYLNGLMLVEDSPAGFYISDLVAGDSSLMNICVHPDFQGKGLGRALLKEYLARSKAKGAEAWFLEVRAGNAAAIGLYESEGFAEYCRRAGYYGSGPEREDAVLMSRLFDFG